MRSILASVVIFSALMGAQAFANLDTEPKDFFVFETPGGVPIPGKFQNLKLSDFTADEGTYCNEPRAFRFFHLDKTHKVYMQLGTQMYALMHGSREMAIFSDKASCDTLNFPEARAFGEMIFVNIAYPNIRVDVHFNSFDDIEIDLGPSGSLIGKLVATPPHPTPAPSPTPTPAPTPTAQ